MGEPDLQRQKDYEFVCAIHDVVAELLPLMERVKALTAEPLVGDAGWRARLVHDLDEVAAICESASSLESANPAFARLQGYFRSAMHAYLIACAHIPEALFSGNPALVREAQRDHDEANRHLHAVADVLAVLAGD